MTLSDIGCTNRIPKMQINIYSSSIVCLRIFFILRDNLHKRLQVFHRAYPRSVIPL